MVCKNLPWQTWYILEFSHQKRDEMPIPCTLSNEIQRGIQDSAGRED